MLFADIARASHAVGATYSRLAKTRIIADLLSRAAEEPSPEPTPSHASEAAEPSTMAPSTAWLAVRYLSGGVRQRRTGVEVRALRGGPAAPDEESVRLQEVDAVLQRAGELAGPGSSGARSELVRQLQARLTAPERALLVGLIRGGVRQGAQESVVLDAVAAAAAVPAAEVRRAVMVGGSLPDVADAVLREGPAALDRFRLRAGQPVGPMLAGSAKSLAEALARTGPAGVEWKLDGIRAQLHKDGEVVRVLTRSLDDITDRVPEVVEQIRTLAVREAILDAELIALRPDDRPRPFQQTGSRTASRTDPRAGRTHTPLTTYVFDVLHLDGTDLVDESAADRRTVLEHALPAGLLAPRLAVADVSDPEAIAAAEAFTADALARGHEGVMVKAAGSAYSMGRRGAGWIKVKPVLTLDLVVLAVERGNGRRQGWWSNIHLGARDPDGRYGRAGGFVMLGKTFKGMTDAMLTWQTEELPRYAASQEEPGYVLWLRPEVVYEIAFDGLQTSTRYPAGLALRFARVVRHRPDKSADQADTIELVEQLAR